MIRTMTRDDKDAVLKLAKVFFDERLNEIGMIYSAENASRHFDELFDKTFALVYEFDGEVVGMIAGVISAKIFCEGITAQEIVWFVHPDHRKAGVKLLKAFEKVAKDKGCEDITMVGIAEDASNKFYLRVGYKKLQVSYFKKVG